MSIQVADNFSYQGAKPLDARVKYGTIAEMKLVPAAALYDGCLSYVIAEHKYYTYDSANEIDETLGKWRELQTADDALSTTSENPIQNKVITNALSNKADLVSGKVPSTQLPSYVDDVIEGYYKEADGKFYEDNAYTTEIMGESGKIYVSLDTLYEYRWSGSAFARVNEGVVLGETSSTAYRGDRGKIAYDDSQTNKTSIGDLTTLTTTDKTDLVGAINEVNAKEAQTIQVDTMPVASASELGKVYQYIGKHDTDINYASNATSNFTGEGTSIFFYTIASNYVDLRGQSDGYGFVKCTQPLPNKGTISITKNYNGVGTNQFTTKTRLGTTIGGKDVYESADWGRASGVEVIDLSQFDAPTIYISFRMDITLINSGQVAVYTIPSVLYHADDEHIKGYFYECVEKANNVYEWEQTNVQPCRAGKDETQEITKAEFDALSQSEKDNGLAYFIPDAEILTDFTVMGNRFDKANIYTADERMIGSWMGKPLYQKTYDLGVLPNSTTKTVALGITNYVIKNISGLASNSSGMIIPLAYVRTDNIDQQVHLDINNDSIRIITKKDYSSFTGEVTIQYTKTSDATVNIGTGNDYSTDEQIIGTWIDGKPLYQKTISITLSNNGDNQINHNIENVNNIMVDLSHSYVIVGSEVFPLTCVNQGSSSYINDVVLQWVNTTKMDIVAGSNRLGSGYVTLQYTKTTD